MEIFFYFLCFCDRIHEYDSQPSVFWKYCDIGEIMLKTTAGTTFNKFEKNLKIIQGVPQMVKCKILEDWNNF